MDEHQEAVFFSLHSGMPRQGPGDRESTRRAFSLCKAMPDRPTIADVGCGPGQQTLYLSELTRGPLIAVDLYPIYLQELQQRIAESRRRAAIALLRADMADLPFRRESLHGIWAEGAIYIVGFETGLRAWRPLLKLGGYLAATEITWFTPQPQAAVRRFWSEAYPPMTDIEENLRTAKKCGYAVAGCFALPERAWWQDYYRCIEAKLPALKKRFSDDPAAQQVLDLEQIEIDLYRQHHNAYGYVFYVLQKR